jgi:riboflavin kinase/FMN adenylyltransferase
MPGNGVYAGTAVIGDQSFLAAISIGNQPSFQGQDSDKPLAEFSVLEVHLIDFEGDLYGKQIHVRFERKIRDQAAFETTEALVVQIQNDINLIKKSTEISA